MSGADRRRYDHKRECPSGFSRRECRMKIRVGDEMIYDFPQPMPIILVLSIG
ncbi:MAG: hypothetical protein ACREFD_09125 [Stellaceae bacterium]